MDTIEFTDRYEALGMPYPEPETMCQGDCEGTGAYPLAGPCPEAGRETSLWEEAHQACSIGGRARSFFTGKSGRYGLFKDLRWAFRRCDGWHFVKCPACDGTGRRT